VARAKRVTEGAAVKEKNLLRRSHPLRLTAFGTSSAKRGRKAIWRSP